MTTKYPSSKITRRPISISRWWYYFQCGNSTLQVTKDKCWPLRKALNLKFGAKLPNQYHRLSKSSRESFARITQFPSNVHRKLNRSTVSKCFENRYFPFEKRSSKKKETPFSIQNDDYKKKERPKKNYRKKISFSREEKEKRNKGRALPPPSISANKPFRRTLSPPL